MAKHRQSTVFAFWHERRGDAWRSSVYMDEFSTATLEYRLERMHNASHPNCKTEFVIISDVEYLTIRTHPHPHHGMVASHYKLMAVEEMRGLVR
jgi:hypothetical protein